MKNGGKNKSVAFIILFSVVILHFDKCSSRITKDGGYHNNLENVPLTFDNQRVTILRHHFE